MMIFHLLLLTAPAPAEMAEVQTTVNRGGSLEIPLISGVDSFGVDWGLDNRKADHATVAMNDQRDVVVAFHSSRDEYTPNLKQVEIAYFQYNNATDNWTLLDRRLLGGVDPTPLFPLLTQPDVKCERPDVIAVGDRFFVVWTRRYDRDFGPTNPAHPAFQGYEPALLECA